MRSVLFVIGCLELGGAERQLSLLASELVKRGWSVKVFVLEKRGPLVDFLDRQNVTVIDGKYKSNLDNKLFKSISLFSSMIRLYLLILFQRPSVVHGFLPLTNFFAALTGRLAFIGRVITSRRGLGTHQERNRFWSMFDRISNRFSDKITANSKAVAFDTQIRDQYPAEKIHIIPNGLVFEEFDTSPGSRKEQRDILNLVSTDLALVMVANLIPYKGHSDLLTAFSMIKNNCPNLKLFLGGSDSAGIKENLIAQARELDIEDNIIFLGQVKDIPRLLSAMDIGILASHEEGLPNALIEKIAAGLPVIATNVGGCAEIITDVPDCYLVPAKSPSDIADAINRAYKNISTSKRQSDLRAQIIRTRYSVSKMVDAYEELYNKSSV